MPPKPRSPILLVAYGQEGLLWLDALARTLQTDGLSERVPFGSLVQFWAVVDDAEESAVDQHGEIWVVDGGNTLQEMKGG